MMATRCGSIDPGIVPYVQTQYGLTAAECEEILNRQSGLAAVSGLSADMRQLLEAAAAGHERAALAIAMYVHRIRVRLAVSQRHSVDSMRWFLQPASAKIRRRFGNWSVKNSSFSVCESTTRLTARASPTQMSLPMIHRRDSGDSNPGELEMFRASSGDVGCC